MKYAYKDKKGKLHLVHDIEQWQTFRGVRNWPNLTDEQRREKRWYPVTEVNADYDARIQNRSGPVLSLEDGVVTATYTITDKSLEFLIEQKCRQVDNRRDQELSMGVEYEFPDGEIAVVQTRDSKDERNIMVNATKALTLVMSGNPDSPMQFRTEDDVLRDLTAQQMLDMTSYVGEKGQEIYSISWTIKDNIRALTDPLEVVTAPVWVESEEPEEV